jgi:hypothetical protein
MALKMIAATGHANDDLAMPPRKGSVSRIFVKRAAALAFAHTVAPKVANIVVKCRCYFI